jgi:catecholate siderophore receptor
VRTAAVFVLDTLKLTPQWELVGGIRFDHIESEFQSRSATGTFFGIGREDNLTSGQGAVVYKPLPNGSVYVAYGTSFNPSAEFLALAGNAVNVEPEENRSYEIGTKWDVLDKQLALTLAIFRTDKTNARQTDPFGGVDLVLIGEQRAQGLEAGFSGAITRNWNIYGGYTFLDTEIIKSVTPGEVGKHLPNVPTHAFSLFTTYQVLRDWQVGFGATYNSPRYANNTNSLKLPPFWRFDAMAAYRINENVSMRLNLLNITDEFYYDSTQNGNYAFVAPGRSALLTTSFNF